MNIYLKRNILKTLLFALITVFSLGWLYMYVCEASKLNSLMEEKFNQELTTNESDIQILESITMDNAVKVKKNVSPTDIDISTIKISSDIENFIKKTDSKNADKNINNYKRIIKDLDIPDNYKNEIEKSIKKGYKISDVLITYEFLYENYGLTRELEYLLIKRKSGKEWAEIFKEYKDSCKEFVPTSFLPGYLESLMKDPNITGDDVMIADRISQKGLKKFDELISMRIKGIKWKEISSELGLVNNAEKLPRLVLAKERVEKQVERTGLNENQIVNALIISEKYGLEDDMIIDKVKKGIRIEEIYESIFTSRYN